MMTKNGATKSRSNNGYISPECVASEKESEVEDVYSVGILLLELVSGKRQAGRLSATTKHGITVWVYPFTCLGCDD